MRNTQNKSKYNSCYREIVSALISGITTSVLMLSGAVNMAAQEELEKYYIPPANSVFSNAREEEAEKKALAELPDYVIRWNFTTLTRSILSFEYEKTMSPELSIGFVGGYCFGKDLLQTGSIDMTGLTSVDSGEQPSWILENSTSNGGGPALGAFLRLYLDNYMGADKYFEFHIRHWSYGYDFEYFEDIQNGNIQGRFANYVFALLYGNQSYSGSNDTFVFDRRLGLGLNIVRFDSISREYNSNSGNDELYSNDKQSMLVPMVYYSLAIGFAKYSK